MTQTITPEALELALDALDDAMIAHNKENDGASVHWISYTRDQRLEVVRAAILAALPELQAAPAAAGVPDVSAVAAHMEEVVQYIERAYPDAKMLDRGPILRNLRRWSQRLRNAQSAAQPQAEQQGGAGDALCDLKASARPDQVDAIMKIQKHMDAAWIAHPQTVEAKSQWDAVADALGADRDCPDAVLAAALAARQPVGQEPVGYANLHQVNDRHTNILILREKGEFFTLPLYTAPPAQVDIEELRRAVCVVGIVGKIDGHDVVRRSSVLDVIDTRRQRLTDSQGKAHG